MTRTRSIMTLPLPSSFDAHALDRSCTGYYRFAKRAIDLLGASLLLTILAPLLATVYLTLLITTRGKPLFCQTRVGKDGETFKMVKFRTMVVDAEQRRHEVVNEKAGPIFKNRNDSRITRIGRLLRMTSLDETPQIFHVLSGKMSLVGPRPPIVAEVERYTNYQRKRLSVKPGLTCLWQISGRSDLSFEEWIQMDLWYVAHRSITTDLTLLAKTPWAVLTGRGAY